MEQSEFRQAQSTFSTDFLFLAYNNEPTFHQQLDNVAKILLNYVETCPNYWDSFLPCFLSRFLRRF